MNVENMRDDFNTDEIKNKETKVESPLQELIVQYIGKKLKPEDGLVTVDMAVQVFSEEFPDFLLCVAEENYVRGWREAIDSLGDLTPEQIELAESEEETDEAV